MNLKCCFFVCVAIWMGGACSAIDGEVRYPTTESPLSLDRVVLYRNGIGYFERRGTVDGDILTLKVRKDQVNDLLKSLTVVDKSSGQALSISIPLDPLAWQNAALSTLSPGNGNLAAILDGLRGTQLTVHTQEGRQMKGRIVMVEEIKSDVANEDAEVLLTSSGQLDHTLTLLNNAEVSVVKLSEVTHLVVHDNDLVMQLHRRLDASAGEGMFQQVEIDIRLGGEGPHNLVVSYVVAAPLWKPTYRIVLDDHNEGEALLQSWAVVDNTSGENWNDVGLSLTAGAPIAFEYDLHTPRNVPRPNLSHSGVEKQATVAFGESTMVEESQEYDDDRSYKKEIEEVNRKSDASSAAYARAEKKSSLKTAPKKEFVKGYGSRGRVGDGFEEMDMMPEGVSGAMAAPQKSVPLSSAQLQSSMKANTTAKHVAGLSKFDLEQRVTLPDGSATMVALINEKVRGKQTFLFKPGGSGSGYEYNPYRVVRFTNSTDFILEPGPISIYSQGSFVGEGLSESVAGKADTTIPFAVEPRIVVRASTDYSYSDLTLTKVVQGVLYTEQFHRLVTTWSVKGMKTKKGYNVLVRHQRHGGQYELIAPTENVEELTDAYFVPITIGPNKTSGSVKVVEQTPAHTTITIWDGNAVSLLDQFLRVNTVDEKTKLQIAPIIALRQEIGRIDTQIRGLKNQQSELDSRVEDTRENLKAIKKDPKATALRKKLNLRLEEFSQKAAKAGREIVELNSGRLEKKIQLEDLLKDFSLTP